MNKNIQKMHRWRWCFGGGGGGGGDGGASHRVLLCRYLSGRERILLLLLLYRKLFVYRLATRRRHSNERTQKCYTRGGGG